MVLVAVSDIDFTLSQRNFMGLRNNLKPHITALNLNDTLRYTDRYK